MEDTESVLTADWFRADRYEVDRGMIRVARGGRIHAVPDAWAQSSAALLDLARLVHLIDSSEGQVSLSESDERRIAEWCSKFGVLGLLGARINKMTLRPRFRVVEEPRRLIAAVTVDYVRSPVGWRKTERWPEAFAVDATSADLIGTMAPDPAISGIDQRDLFGRRQDRRIRLSEVAGAFPSIPRESFAEFDVPMFSSREFCEMYAEPARKFFEAARYLVKVMDQLTSDDRAEVFWGESNVTAIARGCMPQVSKGCLLFRAHSMFECLAMRVAWDHTHGWNLLPCQNHRCPNGGWFTPSRPNHDTYCDPKCRKSARNHENYNNRKELRE